MIWKPFFHLQIERQTFSKPHSFCLILVKRAIGKNNVKKCRKPRKMLQISLK
jgi:hypothetical protein